MRPAYRRALAVTFGIAGAVLALAVLWLIFDRGEGGPSKVVSIEGAPQVAIPYSPGGGLGRVSFLSPPPETATGSGLLAATPETGDNIAVLASAGGAALIISWSTAVLARRRGPRPALSRPEAESRPPKGIPSPQSL